MGAITFFTTKQTGMDNTGSLSAALTERAFKPINTDSKLLIEKASGWVDLADKRYLDQERKTIEEHQVNFGDFSRFGMRIDTLALPPAVKADIDAKTLAEFGQDGVVPKDKKRAAKKYKAEMRETWLRQQIPSVKVVPVHVFDNFLAIGSASEAIIDSFGTLYSTTFPHLSVFPLCAFDILKGRRLFDMIEKHAQGQQSFDGSWLQNRTVLYHTHEKFLSWLSKGFTDATYSVFMNKSIKLKEPVNDTKISITNPRNQDNVIAFAPVISEVGLCAVCGGDVFNFSIDTEFRIKGFTSTGVKGLLPEEQANLEASRIKKLLGVVEGLFVRFIEWLEAK